MRILILSDRIPPENIGGAGKIAWLHAQGLHSAGHDVHVITATPHTSFEEIRDNIPTYHLHSRTPNRWRAWLSLYNPQTARAVKRLIQRIQPDLIHAHNVHTDLGYVSLRQPIPVFFTAHDTMSVTYTKMDHFIDTTDCTANRYHLPRGYNLRQNRLRYNPMRNAFIRATLQNCTRIAVSHALKHALEANQLPSFHVIHNGLPDDAFRTPSNVDTMRQRLQLEGCQTILFAGRLSAEKGINHLLAAVDRLIPDFPSLRVMILAKQAPNVGAFANINAEHIVMPGWLSGDDLLSAFHLADVVAIPSVYLEPFSTVNLEAMAAGKPVLTTCYGGSAEAVIDGETGYVINPFDTDPFTARLRDLLAKPDLATQMGHAARRHMNAAFTLHQHIDKVLSLYQKHL